MKRLLATLALSLAIVTSWLGLAPAAFAAYSTCGGAPYQLVVWKDANYSGICQGFGAYNPPCDVSPFLACASYRADYNDINFNDVASSFHWQSYSCHWYFALYSNVGYSGVLYSQQGSSWFK